MTKRSADYERKVYLLPPDLCAMIRSYQARKRLPSEVEAVRRIIEKALLAEDGIDAILARMTELARTGIGLREVASRGLATHPLIERFTFFDDEGYLTFALQDGSEGRFPDGERKEGANG